MLSSQATGQHNELASVLEQIKELDLKIGELSGQVDDLKKNRATLEKWAIAAFQSSGLDGVRAAGRNWRLEESLHLSVSKDRRDAVLDAARAAGIEDMVTTVATTTLKAWLALPPLVERAKEAGREAGTPFAAGTPFEGIVGEFVEQKLRHVSVG